ncbi:MAG: hypothetical protein FJ356_03980 [Thaumarchaeota archaeon]|nr:hypothetical protein [Nitrososphaerota archaeon]
MLYELNYKKVEIDYSFYSKPIKLGCPFCKFNSSHKTRSYRSLKSLIYHLSNEHKQEGEYYPFILNDIKTLMQNIATSLQWGLLL